MKWKREAVECLDEYKNFLLNGKNAEKRVVFLRTRLPKLRRGCEEWLDLTAELDMLERRIAYYREEEALIEHALKNLEGKHRDALWEVYVKPESGGIETLMKRYRYERRNLYYILDKALRAFAENYFLCGRRCDSVRSFPAGPDAADSEAEEPLSQ